MYQHTITTMMATQRLPSPPPPSTLPATYQTPPSPQYTLRHYRGPPPLTVKSLPAHGFAGAVIPPPRSIYLRAIALLHPRRPLCSTAPSTTKPTVPLPPPEPPPPPWCVHRTGNTRKPAHPYITSLHPASHMGTPILMITHNGPPTPQ